MTQATKQAIKKYGKELCLEAYRYSKDGEGPSTIAQYLGLKTKNGAIGASMANSAINAGYELACGNGVIKND